MCIQTQTSNYNQSLITSYAQPIDSTAFESYEEFELAVKEQWHQLWDTVYNSSDEDLIEYNYNKAHFFNPKLSMTTKLQFYLCEIMMFLGFLYLTYRLPILLIYPFLPVLMELFKKK